MFKKSSGELYNAWMKKPEWLRWFLWPLAILFGLLAFMPVSAPVMVMLQMFKFGEYVRFAPEIVGGANFFILILLCLPRGGMFIIYLFITLIIIGTGYNISHETNWSQIIIGLLSVVSVVAAGWWMYKLRVDTKQVVAEDPKKDYARELIETYGNNYKIFAFIGYILCGFYALGKTWALIKIALGSVSYLLGWVAFPFAAVIAPFYYLFAKGQWAPLVIFVGMPILFGIMYSWGDNIAEGASDVV